MVDKTRARYCPIRQQAIRDELLGTKALVFIHDTFSPIGSIYYDSYDDSLFF